MEELLDIETLFKLKVEELKQELGKRNLTKSGTKSDLQERLLQYVNTHQSTVINYGITCTTDSTEDEEKQETELGCSDKTGRVIDNLEDAKYLNEDIDYNPIQNDDNFSLTNNDADNVDNLSVANNDGDNDDNLSLTNNDGDNQDNDDGNDEIIGVKNVVDKNCIVEDNYIDINITANEDTDKNITHLEKTDKPKVSSIKSISFLPTNTEKKENRGKRFGGPSSETEKKKARLGRFFSTVSGLGKGDPVTEEDEEKIKKRVERFGAVSTLLMPESSDRLKVRQERFADVNIKKRQERFGVVHKQISDLSGDMEVRKQQRLLKFGALD